MASPHPVGPGRVGLGTVLVLLLSVSAAPAGDLPPPLASTAPEAAAVPAPSATMGQVAKELVLCRSPRGAVFAREAAVGCKLGTRLTPDELIDFGGAGLGCSLRAVDTTAGAGSCDATCRTEDARSVCVVGLRRRDGRWTTFAAGAPLAPRGGEADAGPALAVCCRL